MDWVLVPLGVVGAAVVVLIVWVTGRRLGIRYAYEHAEEVFGTDEPLKAEYVIGGRPFFQRPLVIRQLRELAELEEGKDEGYNMHIDPEFYSIILTEGTPEKPGQTGKTGEKTAFFSNTDSLNTVVMQQVQHYFFVCNRSRERIDMFEKLMKEAPATKAKKIG